MIQAPPKERYTQLREIYESGQLGQHGKSTRAEIDIFAGIHNHNRSLFEKGVKKWKQAVMKEFDLISNGGTVNITHVTPTATLDDEGAAALGDQVAAYKGNMGRMAGEQAVYSHGDMIREKREIYEKLEKQLNDRKWWK